MLNVIKIGVSALITSLTDPGLRKDLDDQQAMDVGDALRKLIFDYIDLWSEDKR